MSANPYDPVTTTDTTTLSDDDWGLSLPGVRYKNYYGDSRCKGLCRVIQERPRTSALVCLVIVGVVMLVVIVAVASGGESNRSPTGKEPRWRSQKEGLEFYPIPEDRSIVISFNVMDMGNNDSIKAMLDKKTSAYDMMTQMDEKVYVDCSEDNSPSNKTCRFGRSRFGDQCTSAKDYGYKHATPCILIQLNLPDDVMIKPITSSSPLWRAAKTIMGNHNDSSSIPLICQGKNEEDRKSIGVKGIDGDAIQYYPENSFPSYFYRKRDLSMPFLKPAVMVRLTSLRDENLVHLSCTAWGQLLKFDGSLEDHGLLTTEFAVYIKHRV